MPFIRWRHSHRRLLLPVVILPGFQSDNPLESFRTEGLIDTGATGTGIRVDLAERLALRGCGQRRVQTANGLIWATEYVIRVGFVCGDHDDPLFAPDTLQPYVLDRELVGFELQAGFGYPVLIGMDVIGASDLTIRRDGSAELVIG